MKIILVLLISSLSAYDLDFFGSSILTDSKGYIFRGGNDQNFGRDIDFTLYSKFGINIRENLADKVSFHAQLLGSGLYINPDKWNFVVDYTFLTYRAFSFLKVNFGRQFLPTWYFSEIKDIGFELPITTIPNPIYLMYPIKSFDGLSTELKFFKSIFLKIGTGRGYEKYSISNGTTVNPIAGNMYFANLLLKVNRYLSFKGFYLKSDFDFTTEGYFPNAGAYTELNYVTGIQSADFFTFGTQFKLYPFYFSFEMGEAQYVNKDASYTYGDRKSIFSIMGYNITEKLFARFLFYRFELILPEKIDHNNGYNYGLNYFARENIKLSLEYAREVFYYVNDALTHHMYRFGVDFVF